VTPSSVTLDGSHSATVTLAVVTMAASAGLTQPAGGPPNNGPFALWVAVSGALGLTLLLRGWVEAVVNGGLSCSTD